MEIVPEWDRPAYGNLPGSRICARCHEILQNQGQEGFTSQGLFIRIGKPQDFDRSLREKCRACALLMCALIMSRVRDQRSSNEGHHEVTCDDDYIWLADQHKIKSDMGENWLTIFNLGPTPNVKHTKRSNLWNHWMKTCSESHGICSTAAERTGEWLAPQDASSTQLDTPDRLVEFSTTDAEATFAWRIVHGKDLVHTKYLTLSHCWGSSQPLKLTTRNYASMLELNDFSTLPKTFQHSISVAHTLGFNHIWIDSLCIVQDNIEDWEKEASKMRSIYQNAHLNIAATWASGCGDGLFVKQDRSPTVTLKDFAGDATEYTLRIGNIYFHDVTRAPLNQRGWVVQERYLANRQLSFARSQVYWECHELKASEDFPDGIPEHLQGPSKKRPTHQFESDQTVQEVWTSVVESFSICDFSDVSDRVIALAGIAEQMRAATKDIYLAGLWKKNLIFQLCWKATVCSLRIENLRVSEYFVPSWSWLSVIGEVDYDPAYKFSYARFLCSQVIEVEVSSKHKSSLHSFTGAKLVLRGIVLGARAIPWDGHSFVEEDCTLSDAENPTDLKLDVIIACDVGTSDRSRNRVLWQQVCESHDSDLVCMVIYNNDDFCAKGLFLQRTSESGGNGVYTRIGYSLTVQMAFKIGWPPSWNVQPVILRREASSIWRTSACRALYAL